jgi:hypothetical protein
MLRRLCVVLRRPAADRTAEEPEPVTQTSNRPKGSTGRTSVARIEMHKRTVDCPLPHFRRGRRILALKPARTSGHLQLQHTTSSQHKSAFGPEEREVIQRCSRVHQDRV